jgi:hypothetical protein
MFPKNSQMHFFAFVSARPPDPPGLFVPAAPPRGICVYHSRALYPGPSRPYACHHAPPRFCRCRRCSCSPTRPKSSPSEWIHWDPVVCPAHPPLHGTLTPHGLRLVSGPPGDAERRPSRTQSRHRPGPDLRCRASRACSLLHMVIPCHSYLTLAFARAMHAARSETPPCATANL